MGRLVTLEELEAYRQDVFHADREGRPPRYRDPREVFNEDPNREDGFLVELTEDEVLELIKYRDQIQEQNDANKEQVIQEMMENGNVPAGSAVLPVHQEQGEADTGAYMTEEQATALYDNNAMHADSPDVHPVGVLESTTLSPSIAPEESVVPAPGTIEGAPEPMQSIVEAASLQGNATGSVHQNLVSTPNPEPSATTEDVPDENKEEVVTPATGGDNPVTVEDLNLPDLNEPTSIPSPTAPEQIATQTEAEQTGNNIPQTIDPGTQQFQPAPGENAGPTVPGADSIQTPTLNNEAAVPSEPTNADAVTAADNPSENSGNGDNQPPAEQNNQANDQAPQTEWKPETPPTTSG